MSALQVFVNGIGLAGPGLPDWVSAASVFRGEAEYAAAKTIVRAPDSLPPAERRRVGTAIKLAMAVGFEAARAAKADPATLPTVFSSSGGDCDNCHALCETLASDDRLISPTRFHNSVHNAPSGYWSIATRCMAASTSQCAYDASFSAALLESACQIHASGSDCLLIAYDTSYPQPLQQCRPIADAFGVAMHLSLHRKPETLASLAIRLGEQPLDAVDRQDFNALMHCAPTARSLPLLLALARHESRSLVLEYLEGMSMQVEVAP